MPGLIDAHWHAYLCCNTMTDLLAGDPRIQSSWQDGRLRRPCNGIHRHPRRRRSCFDSNGPSTAGRSGARASIRAGAMISQTSGHGDFRMIYEHAHGGCGCEMAHVEQIGASKIADGADAVTAAVREKPPAGRIADQTDGRRRCRIALRSARCDRNSSRRSSVRQSVLPRIGAPT